MMKILIGSLLVSGAALASPSPDLYVRGAFNGWGIDNLLVFKGNGVYESQIVISPGYHAFKLGSKDWSAEWVIDPAASVSVAPGVNYKMDTHPGAEDFLFVKQTGTYRFTVDVSSAPVLRVVRLADVPVAASDPHAGHQPAVSLSFPTYDGKQETARFSVKDAGALLRDYAQSTTMQLRDPGPQFVRYRESADLPTVRSGNLAFDALFALAGAEMKQDSVSEIKDGNYNGGAAIPCDCFETGEKWHYVWTRDLSYAAHLGLAMLDPVRVMHSLDFKLSGFRSGLGAGMQIIQDTGSGGSWPVSTDRVTWAFGAEEALKTLPELERKAFAARALKALANTIEADRLAAYDPADGLYTGEQSFLDWRDQSYAAWITSDIASLATSKALSTNAGHYKALTLAAMLAREQGQPALAKKYDAWAQDLKRAINERLWLQDEGMYSSLTAGHFDGAPMHKFDWLGQSLAIVTGIASPEHARSILAHYPHGPMGAPVIYPQQQGVPVYHNRAIWPFVTEYGLKAAAQTGNVSVADAAYQSLMRGAALNLSNMENLEWLSGQPLLLDEKNPSLIGPVINSRRQLWSVGAYLGMVIQNVFGVTVGADGIDVKPFITSRLRRETFSTSDSITLNKLRVRGKAITVTIKLPKSSPAEGFYLVDAVTVNGAKASQHIPWNALQANSVVEIRLGTLAPGLQEIRRINADPYQESRAVFGPREPHISNFRRDTAGIVRFDIEGDGVAYNVYRDGKIVAANLPAGAWSDRSATACYAVEAVYPDTGNRSHHSVPVCAGSAIEVPVTPRLGWGKPADTFAVGDIDVPEAGVYQVQIKYQNRANQINLGISGGVKWLALKDADGRVIARHVIQLPHTRVPQAWSTPMAVQLGPGKVQLELTDFYNMSYLQSNSTFSAAGGADGASNRFDIYGIRLLKVK
ncbi:esterase [Massilia sp. R2A-15]|uniref:MGH1-like glycoside hydrolase domain-containing protein n=1 Tax=Massilia sp. R2A-15 TaxID=3064278 RepID=UPI0027352871|nr:esterase [Massilia sp. R2A-15]WLI88182.1 esterase [Massilia sp. R2A-15]